MVLKTEVVVSRILWGLGYHQPPVYYLPSWDVSAGGAEPRKESEARFRPKLPRLDRLPDEWSWADNPFSGTRALKGLQRIKEKIADGLALRVDRRAVADDERR